jgi:hypothetical protein
MEDWDVLDEQSDPPGLILQMVSSSRFSTAFLLHPLWVIWGWASFSSPLIVYILTVPLNRGRPSAHTWPLPISARRFRDHGVCPRSNQLSNHVLAWP